MSVFNQKFVRFSVVGLATAASYTLLYLGFLALGVAQVVANGSAFLIAVVFQYFCQAAFTFERKLYDVNQIIRFSVMVWFGFLTSTLITGPMTTLFGLPDWTAALLVIVYLPLQNFTILTLWVFASTSSKTEMPS